MKEQDDQSLALRPSSMLEVLKHAASDPNVDVVKLTALWDLAERMQSKQASATYNAAMARVQAQLKPLNKTGHFSHMEGKKFVQLQDVDEAVRPLLGAEGFSFSFDEESAEGQNRRYVGRMSHADGHFEIKRITLAVDSGGGKNATQAGGSTASYAQKYLLRMFLNLVTEKEDTDGLNPALITDDQVHDLETALVDTKSNKARFLEHFKIAELKDLPQRDHREAMVMLEVKRRNAK